jgi:hypothetical protein
MFNGQALQQSHVLSMKLGTAGTAALKSLPNSLDHLFVFA